MKYGDYRLFYTKNLADKMPIASTSVGYKPCLNKFHISRRENDAELFYLERDYNKTKCEKYDERFTQLDFTTDEFTVQKNSNVLSKLKSIPGYNITDESKKATEYYFWTRPQGSWKCSIAKLK